MRRPSGTTEEKSHVGNSPTSTSLGAPLRRLYDETVEMKQSRQEARRSLEELRDASQATNQAAAHLLGAVEKHQQVVEPHERGLDRTEITTESILEDLGGHREQRPSQ